MLGRIIILMVSITAVFLARTGVATAGGEVLACEGRYVDYILDPAVSPNQRVDTSFTLSNFNDAATIRINRIVVYGFDGATFCDSNEGEFTAGYDIGPNGGTWFNVMPGNCSGMPAKANYNMKIYWSASGSYKNPLHGKATTRTFEIIDGVVTGEVSRSSHECISVK
jgi:hypothetical protein